MTHSPSSPDSLFTESAPLPLTPSGRQELEQGSKILRLLAPGWAKLLGDEFEKPYMNELRHFLRTESQAGKRVFPPTDKIFQALVDVDIDAVKVVVLGQDPYHGEGQAIGRAFAVANGVPPPPSLQNIFKEVASDVGISRPSGTSLDGWARQGVLLLNTVLTVRSGEAFSHRKQGWETFTDRVICELNNRTSPMVFLLWGSPAQLKSKMIINPRHLILRAPHPSPLSAHRGFFGSKPFTQANAFLSAFTTPIDWART